MANAASILDGDFFQGVRSNSMPERASYKSNEKPMIEQISEDMQNNVVALCAHGMVSHKDYERVVIPTVEEKIRLYSKVRFLFVLADDFEGYTAEAMWDDTKIGLQHLTAFEKIAVVTNTEWVKEAVRFFGFFVPCPVKVFPKEEIQSATAWANE